MNDTLTRSHQMMERHAPPKKKGCGCLLNALIGIAVFLTAILVAVWLLIMHSSLPLRSVASMIETAGAQSHLKVTGISGSLSSGLRFKKMKWDDGEIADVRVRYSGIMDVIRRKQLILHEVHVGSAFIDTAFDSDESQDAESESPEESTTGGKPADWPLRLLRIDRLSLNHIVIKDRASGVTVNIPKLDWTGFKAEKGSEVEFGSLDAVSDYLVLKTTAPRSSVYQKRIEIGIMPKMHALILKPVHLAIEFGLENGKPVFDLRAFDETVTMIAGSDGIQHIRAEEANLADFIDMPLPRNLRLEAETGDPDKVQPFIRVRGGSFQLGVKSFEVQSTTASGTGEKPEGTVLLALCREGYTIIRYEIPITGTKEQDQSFTPLLASTPPMSPEDIMALLFHGAGFSTLPPQDQEKLRGRMSWFSFSK
jgi:hypothetical protein